MGSAAGRVSSGGPEQRQPHVLDLFEDNLHLLTELQLLGIAVNDVGGQPNPRILCYRDLGDDVRRG